MDKQTQASKWDIEKVRAAFPSLAIRDDGLARIYADAPAGSQVPSCVIDKMREAMIDKCANDGGVFRTSRASEEIVFAAHDAAAAFLNAPARDEIVFGLNTTSLFFNFARMLSREWIAGDEIVLTRMDHDANIAPWLDAAEEKGVTVRWLDFDPETFEYCYEQLENIIGPRTRLVACNHASNIFGTINDIRRIVSAGRAVGAITIVDAVQSAPHIPLDVQDIGCDILACSAYKFFGPHAAILYLRASLRDRLRPLKVRPSSMSMPWRFAPGTPSFEAQAGTLAAIEHIAWLGTEFAGVTAAANLREKIVAGLQAATSYENSLMLEFLDLTTDIPGFKLFGIGNSNRLDSRVPTFSFRLNGCQPNDVANSLATMNIFSWSGNFYAMEAEQKLELQNIGGVNRVGLAHYTSLAEVKILANSLAEMVKD